MTTNRMKATTMITDQGGSVIATTLMVTPKMADRGNQEFRTIRDPQ